MKKILFSLFQQLLPDMWFQRIWASYIGMNSKYNVDRYQYPYMLSYKRNQKMYFIFRYEAPGFGILAVARNILLACEWAEKNNAVPVIDFEWRYLFQGGLLGQDNLWEYIFEAELSAKKVIEEGNVFVGAINGRYSDKQTRKELFNSEDKDLITIVDKNWREYYKKLNYYSRKWWKIRDDVFERIEQTFSKLFTGEMKILGVALREEFAMQQEDILGTALAIHPHQIGIDEMIEIIRKYKEKWNCTHVFVTTYMQDSIERLQKEFGETLIYTSRRRVDFEKWRTARRIFEEYITNKEPKELFDWIQSEDINAKIVNTYDKETIIEYIEEVYGLSLCDYLLAGKSGGTLAACIWNGGKYNDIEIMTDENKSYLY